MILLSSLPMFIAGAVSFIFFLFFIILIPKINKSDLGNQKFFSSYLVFLALSFINSIFNICFGVFLNSGNDMFFLSISNRLIIITAMYILVLYIHFIIKFFGLKIKFVLPAFYSFNTFYSILTLINTPLFLYDEFVKTSSFYMGMKTGFLFWTCGAYVILILITAGITTYRGFRKIFRNENINSVPLMFLSVSSFLWFVSGILDVLTAVRVIDLPPLSWIGSIVIVLTIAFVLIITIENLCDKVQNLYKELIHDNLTNAYSKSFFEISFNAVYNNLCRNDSKNFLVLFDVDDFKKVNDKSGHLFGDHVLKELIDIVKSGLRSSDIVARFGGDEFLVLIKDCEETNDIIAMIDRVREKVSEYIFESGKKRSKITCSFGVTVFDSLAVKSNLTYDEIFATADLALYKSKENGKNMITVMDLPNK